MAELDIPTFVRRLDKCYSHFIKHNASVWDNVSCLLLHRGSMDETQPYLKSSILHQWMFGYELPDTVLLLTPNGHIYLLATQKKIDFVKAGVAQLDKYKSKKSRIKEIHLLVRNKADGNAAHYQTLLEAAGLASSGKENAASVRIGVLLKEQALNTKGLVGPWEAQLKTAPNLELVDVDKGYNFLLATKDEAEVETLKKSSVLVHKVMKHGFVKRLEEIIDGDDDQKVPTHTELSNYVEGILEDPSKLKIKVPPEDVASAKETVVCSGGTYDTRVFATPNAEPLSYDIITVSLGARYQNYCSHMARTFLVDPPPAVTQTYELLTSLYDACLAKMKPGRHLKEVQNEAIAFLKGQGREDLIPKLPKSLGFGMGLDFRNSAFLLNGKNMAAFKAGMAFTLSISFTDVELSEASRKSCDDKSPIKKLSKYSLTIADMVSISPDGPPDVMTKFGRNLTDVAYHINQDSDNDDDDDDSDESDDAPDAPDGDEAYARKVAKQRDNSSGVRQSSRLARDAAAVQESAEGVAEREKRQIKLMTRRNEERLRELARQNRKKGDGDDKDEADELVAYKRTKDYPDNVQPNQVKVDMANKCVLLPICGVPVPFHISTIKNVVMPEGDGAYLLRINFYTAGMALGKEAPVNMIKLVQKYAPYASFVREMTFRSLDGHNLTLAFRQISELRKRERQKEILQQEEATLVKQEKLVRTKNEKVPRLADLTMRPVFAGKKTQGNLEAHTNGLRFISTRSEVVDIMYANIKYAIYQKCEGDVMVLIHFHLKNPIMVGKKKHIDIQFFTEVIDSSQAVDNVRRSMYDPDEMDDEQRERQLRKRLNEAFKNFCQRVDKVAKANDYQLEFDIPYRDLGFTGNPHKEMVSIVPTLNCLVNLTETPFFVVDLEHVDHVHFERVTYMSKAFDMILVNKDFNKQPWRIDMIPNGDKDAIQEWLTDMEITYTEGPMNLNWKQIMSTIKDDDRFYMETEEDEVTEKEAGWEFLRMYGREDEEEEDPDADDSEFDEAPGDDAVSEEEDEDDFDSDVDDDDDEDDFDGDEDLDEEGLDWDEMEMKAAADDRRKRDRDEDLDEEPVRKKKNNKKNRRR